MRRGTVPVPLLILKTSEAVGATLVVALKRIKWAGDNNQNSWNNGK